MTFFLVKSPDGRKKTYLWLIKNVCELEKQFIELDMGTAVKGTALKELYFREKVCLLDFLSVYNSSFKLVPLLCFGLMTETNSVILQNFKEFTTKFQSLQKRVKRIVLYLKEYKVVP